MCSGRSFEFFRGEELGSFFFGAGRTVGSEIVEVVLRPPVLYGKNRKGLDRELQLLVIGFGAGQLSCRTRFLRGPADSENRVQFVM